MLNFQTDYDEATGEQVLTCFLLPQMEYQQENMGESKNKKRKKISQYRPYFPDDDRCIINTIKYMYLVYIILFI